MSVMGYEPLDDDLEIETDEGEETARVQYVVFCTEDGTWGTTAENLEPEDAFVWAKDNLPSEFAGIPKKRVRLDEVIDDHQITFEVEFGYPSDSNSSGSRRDDGTLVNPIVSIDTTGKTERKYYSIETAGAFLRNGDEAYWDTSTDFQNGINCTDAGPQGVDVIANHFSWQEKWYFDANTVSWDYLKNLGNMTGTTNKAAFRGFDAESILFTGAHATPNANNDMWEVTFGFQYSKPVDVDDIVKPVSKVYFPTFFKRGWHYFWAYFLEVVDTAKGINKRSPQQITVEKVYFDEDFEANLAIGADLPETANIPLTGSPAISV